MKLKICKLLPFKNSWFWSSYLIQKKSLRNEDSFILMNMNNSINNA